MIVSNELSYTSTSVGWALYNLYLDPNSTSTTQPFLTMTLPSAPLTKSCVKYVY